MQFEGAEPAQPQMRFRKSTTNVTYFNGASCIFTLQWTAQTRNIWSTTERILDRKLSAFRPKKKKHYNDYNVCNFRHRKRKLKLKSNLYDLCNRWKIIRMRLSVIYWNRAIYVHIGKNVNDNCIKYLLRRLTYWQPRRTQVTNIFNACIP